MPLPERRAHERDEIEPRPLFEEPSDPLEAGSYNAAIDQWGAALRPTALVAGQYSRACVDAGFSRTEAFELTKVWLSSHFDCYGETEDE